MTPEEKLQLDVLCKRVIVEKDPNILSTLVKQLNDLLEEHELRVRAAWKQDPFVIKPIK